MKKYVMALDQGTTSSRCILFDRQGNIVSMAQKEFTQVYPKPGWVEHDPMEIWSSQVSVAMEAISKIGASASEVAALGITNQRETTIVWNKNTGKPVYNAIVWQCRRTADLIDKLKKDGLTDYVRETTGLIPDAYFSASKLAWILDNVEGARSEAEAGNLLFGTVATWLIWLLTKGVVHVTDYTNASRTMMYDINNLCWDEKLLNYFNIPVSMLPTVRPSSCVFGVTDSGILGGEIPIAGAAGDQQAALFGQCCFTEGDVKNTYGTGCFMLLNTGDKPVKSEHGLLTTIAASVDDNVTYALEGSVFVAGAGIQWLRDEMDMLRDSTQSEAMAQSVEDTAGVYIVPAFTGLGAPYWNPYARGTVVGITRGCQKEHFIRAALESIAYQTADVLRAMVDWAFSFGNIYEVTAETTHTNDRCVHALNKARFVLREGDRFREFYSIKKQKTSWTGLYLFIGITIGMILTLVFDDPKVGMGIGILVSLFIGGSLDIGEKKNREKVTGKK